MEKTKPMKIGMSSLRARRMRNAAALTLTDNQLELSMNCNFNMDLNGFSSVGTQTPTDDNSFEFPDVFTPSPSIQSSSLSSSIGTQTDARQRMSYESPGEGTTSEPSRSRPKLFRRHSTGSDVYSFCTSPTLVTAFGGAPFGMRGYLTNRMLSEESERLQMVKNERRKLEQSSLPEGEEGSQEDLEMIGQKLREIGDNYEREGLGIGRSRSGSVVMVSQYYESWRERRRTSNSSSSSSSSS